jgi:hypothetical protein
MAVIVRTKRLAELRAGIFSSFFIPGKASHDRSK